MNPRAAPPQPGMSRPHQRLPVSTGSRSSRAKRPLPLPALASSSRSAGVAIRPAGRTGARAVPGPRSSPAAVVPRMIPIHTRAASAMIDDDQDGEEGGQHAVDGGVGDDLLHVVDVLRRRQHLARVERRPGSVSRWAKKPSLGSSEKTFCQLAVRVTAASQASGTPVTQAHFSRAGLDQDGGADGQRDRGQQLVGDAEQREQLVDAAERVGGAGPRGSSPRRPTTIALVAQRPGFQETRPIGFQTLPSVSCSMKRPTRVPASTVVRMNRASNMIAKWYQKALSAAAAEDAGEDLRHADGQGGRAAGAGDERLLLDRVGGRLQLVRGDGEAEVGHRGGGRLRGVAHHAGGRVHGEVEAGVEHRRGDDGHHGDEGLHQHRAVADHPDLRLLLDHLRGGARGDQGVEAGQGAAGDDDEHEREQRAGEDRPGPVEANSVKRSFCEHRQRHQRRRRASRTIVPIFMKVER